MNEKEAPKPFNGLQGLSAEEVLEIIGDPRGDSQSLGVIPQVD